MSNRHGLDANYFCKKLHILIRGADHYTPAEMARALARLAKTADQGVLSEQEFAPVSDGYVRVSDAVAICRQEAAEWDSDNLVTHKNYAATCGVRIAMLAAKAKGE